MRPKGKKGIHEVSFDRGSRACQNRATRPAGAQGRRGMGLAASEAGRGGLWPVEAQAELTGGVHFRTRALLIQLPRGRGSRTHRSQHAGAPEGRDGRAGSSTPGLCPTLMSLACQGAGSGSRWSPPPLGVALTSCIYLQVSHQNIAPNLRTTNKIKKKKITDTHTVNGRLKFDGRELPGHDQPVPGPDGHPLTLTGGFP